jgi:hypothetical protein
LAGFLISGRYSLAKTVDGAARIVPPRAAIVPDPGLSLNRLVKRLGFLPIPNRNLKATLSREMSAFRESLKSTLEYRT